MTSVNWTSTNAAPASHDLLKLVRTRMDLLKLAFARSRVDRLQSVRFAPSKRASRTSLFLKELPLKSAFVKSEPRSALAVKFPLWAVTPAKSLSIKLLALTLIFKFLSRTNKAMGAAQTCKLCQLDPINERELPLKLTPHSP